MTGHRGHTNYRKSMTANLYFNTNLSSLQNRHVHTYVQNWNENSTQCANE